MRRLDIGTRPPWLPNFKKRLVKSPKVYVRDSGLLHTLLQVGDLSALQSHPRLEASWKGFALEQLCLTCDRAEEDLFFWATHGGAKMNVVLRSKWELYGFEFKATEAPSVTHSMTIAKADLGLRKVFLLYPGPHRFTLREEMAAVGYEQLANFRPE